MLGDPNTRRSLTRLLMPAIVATTFLFVAACGSSSESSTDAATATTAAGATASAFPVTVAHKFGATEVEREPERVVTVGLTDQDAALAVGVVPVGTSEWFGNQPGAIFPWATDALGDAELPTVIADTAGGLNFEAIAALQPDVILAVYSGLSQSDYDTLSAIAPTVAQPKEYDDWGVPWQDQTRIVGAALGRAEQAEATVQEVESQLEAARAAHPEFDGAQGAVSTVYGGQLSVYAPEDSRGRFLTSLGFRLPDGLEELAAGNFSADVSMERTDLIDGDVVVWLINDRDTDVPQFEAEPLYAQLDVHKQGRDIFVEMGEPVGAATSFITVLSMPLLIEQMVPMLASAVDGDPAT